ncbi:hypothetical protein ACWQ06_16100 [Streptomyces angustmyceticus]
METTRRTTGEPARLGDPQTQRTFGRAKFLVAAYGALSAAVLAAVAVRALTGHPVTSFLWGRSAGVLASAAVTYWLTVLAARGARCAFLRVRLVSVVMPVAIVGVDLIPGVCPAWFALAQATCALAVGAAACVVNGPLLRAVFPRER